MKNKTQRCEDGNPIANHSIQLLWRCPYCHLNNRHDRNCCYYGKGEVVQVAECERVRFAHAHYRPKEDDEWRCECLDVQVQVPTTKLEVTKATVNDYGRSKYLRTLPAVNDDGQVDVYSVLVGFGVTCPATAHAVKKLLCAGVRDKGSRLQDLEEAKVALERAIALERGK